MGGELRRKDRNALGGLNPVKAFERLAILHQAHEKTLVKIEDTH